MLNLILEFHRDAERQGPGSDEMTLRALEAAPNSKSVKSILDIGCGTGAQTMVLAKNTQAQITAVDIMPMFLEALPERARTCGVTDRNCHFGFFAVSGQNSVFPPNYDCFRTPNN
jgi:methylase of polypeptide subunit release factors